MQRASNVSKPFWEQYSSMEDPLIINCWWPSVPSALNRLQPLKVPTRPSTNYSTTWPLTLKMVSSTEKEIWFLMFTMILDSIMNPRTAADL